MQEFRSPGDAAHIAVEHFLDILPDHRPAFCGSEHHVNQATCVAVRHDFDRGSYSHSSVPRTVVLGHSQPSLAGLVSVWECEPRTSVLGYSQPSLRDWTVHFGESALGDETGYGERYLKNRAYLAGCLDSGLSFSA
jgi:hypothetical protein